MGRWRGNNEYGNGNLHNRGESMVSMKIMIRRIISIRTASIRNCEKNNGEYYNHEDKQWPSKKINFNFA